MGLFSSSRSVTSTSNEQLGVEGEDNIINKGTLNNYFPDSVAGFATEALGLAKSVVTNSASIANQSQDALSKAATTQQAPVATLTPLVGLVVAGIAAIFILGKK